MARLDEQSLAGRTTVRRLPGTCEIFEGHAWPALDADEFAEPFLGVILGKRGSLG